MDSSEATLYHAVIIGSILFAGLFIFLGIIIFRSQRRYFKLQQARLLAEVTLLEKERTRIARDLHDELGPTLTVTDILLAQSLKDKDQAQELIQKAQENITRTNQRLGEIARNLIPHSLSRKGLDFALREFVGQFESSGKISIHYRYEVSSAVAENTGLQVFRMLQEIVNNAMKHSEASSLVIQLKERKQRLYILCKDNGKGMPDAVLAAHSKGLGINSLRNRAELLGGKMRFVSRNGTEYFFEIPIKLYSHGKNDQDRDSR